MEWLLLQRNNLVYSNISEIGADASDLNLSPTLETSGRCRESPASKSVFWSVSNTENTACAHVPVAANQIVDL